MMPQEEYMRSWEKAEREEVGSNGAEIKLDTDPNLPGSITMNDYQCIPTTLGVSLTVPITNMKKSPHICNEKSRTR